MSTTTGSLSSHVIKTTGTGASTDNVIPVASLFSSADFIQPSTAIKKSTPPPLSPTKRSASLHQAEKDNEQTSYPSPSRTVTRPSNGAKSALGFTRSSLDRTSARDRISSSLNVHPEQYQQIITKTTTSCSQHDTVPELCRICHERTKRNIPVYLYEEKRVRDEDETKLLEEHQHNIYLQDRKRREVYL